MTQEIEGVVDTGFSEFLTIPHKLTEELQLTFDGVDYLILANGEIETFEVYKVTVTWDGCEKKVKGLI